MAEMNMKKIVQEAAEEIMNQVRSDVGMTLKECWEKQLPMKIQFDPNGLYGCPICKHAHNGHHYNYCPDCGQRLDWGD